MSQGFPSPASLAVNSRSVSLDPRKVTASEVATRAPEALQRRVWSQRRRSGVSADTALKLDSTSSRWPKTAEPESLISLFSTRRRWWPASLEARQDRPSASCRALSKNLTGHVVVHVVSVNAYIICMEIYIIYGLP